MDSVDCDLKERIEALRRELAGLVVALCKASRQLDDLADEIRSHRQTSKVVPIHQCRRDTSPDPDILDDPQR